MAMRTAMPLATCWVTTVRGRSATSEAISTPAHHRPGMGHDGVFGQPLGPARREAPAGRVLAQAGDERPAPPLRLQAQERDHVGIAERGIEVGRHLDGPAFERRRQQAARCRKGDVRSQGGVGEHLGASHPAVAHVADDQDAQILEAGDARARRARRPCARPGPGAR